MAGKLQVTKAQAVADDEKRPLLKDIHVSVNRHDPSSSALSGLGDRYPSQDATCISSALFSWVTPLMELGNQRPLEHDDLYLLDPANRAHEVSTDFQEAWKKQCSKPGSKPSLTWTLASCFGAQIAKAGLLKLIHDSLQFVGPMLIKEIIAYLQNPDAPLSEGLVYAGIVFVSGVMQSFLLRNYFFHCFEAGMRVRSAVCTAVYTKSLVLSAAARQKKTTGEITNLMSIDAQRLQELSTYINSVWFSIFQIVVACYLLWKQIGPATFAGVAVIILMLPVTAGISKLMRRLQLKLMEVKDERIKICNEVLAGMKVIKLQAWEHSFTKRVLEYRSEELSKLRTYIYARSGSMTLFSAIPSLVTVASFYTFVKLGNTLDVGTALTSLALFNILRFPLFMLPQVLNSIVEASVSIDRLRSYFQEEEREQVGPGDLDGVGVRVNNADFMWDTAPKTSPTSDASTVSKEEDSLLQEDSILDKEALGGDSLPVLQSVSLEARPGDLIAVVGHVGAGKSTLLSGILGDARCSRGDVSLRGSVAYVSQQPFIQNATVRENICFGLPFNEAKYAEALRVSSMQKDLTVLPGGDMTEIGEKGINLSGGQRTRVALARAVYQDADIYLLDDILSAVDSHVGHDIFKECIKTCLKDKLVVLVTHGLTFLSECGKIVVLENGVIMENGSYEDLMEKDGGLLMDLVAKYKDQDAQQDSPTIEDEISVDELEEDEEDNPTPERLARRMSRSSVRSERSLSEAGMEAQLMTDEDRSVGDVAWQVYKTWIMAFGGIFAGLVVIVIFIATQFVNLLSTWWLSFWSEHSQPKDGPADKESEMFYVYIYMALNLVYAVALYIRAITTYKGGLRASKSLFQNLLARILRAPTSFFDTTPTGRIVNRLSKDVYTVDESIPATWSMLLNTFISVLVTLATISYVTPIFMVILLPVLVGYYISQRYFIKSSRELQRLDSISRSPVFALLSETLDGLPTIRAYRAETQFSTKNEELIDRNQRAYFLNFAVNCWLALRLEFAGTLIAAFAALTAVLAHSSDPERGAAFAGLAGVSLTYAFSVTQSLNWSVRMLSQLQTQMVSVERIKNYTVMDVEAELTSVGKLPPAQEWPSAGAIEFRNVNLRYRPGLPRVLRNLSLSIRPQEKIGIVGRTGAGKSSLVVALMRLVELDSGSIVIDGLDISTIGLHELRNKISIIPQDPVLFSGTVRSNVDPFDQYTDEQIWTSLRRAHLAHVVSALDGPVDEKGSNFSVGERQLLCIARALLKRSRIILMDEATASIDTETDRKIQRSIREEFRDCTCLTIAHRINTILDADRILVMERGAVGEFDTPKALQKKQDGLFKALVEHWKNEVFDHATLKWKCAIPTKTRIETRFGKGFNIVDTREGSFKDSSMVLSTAYDNAAEGRIFESKTSKPVRVLDLRGSHVDLEIVTQLSRELTLSYNVIGEIGSTALAKALATNSRLQVLDLMHNRIGKDGITPWLGDTMRVNYALRELKLSHNAIGDQKTAELLQSLAPKPLTEEEKLKACLANRRHTTMPHKSPEAQTDSEPFNSTLRSLLLSNTGISDEASTHLAHMLSHTRSLTHLDISCNNFTSEGNVNIAQGMQRNATLRYLNYRENKLDEVAALAILRALKTCSFLETALFQDCFGGESTVGSALGQLLSTADSLVSLDLSHCSLEPPGVVDFYYALAENTSLRSIDLTCSGLKSDSAAGILAKSLQQNSTLTFINLAYNEITLRGCKVLRDGVAGRSETAARLVMSLEGNSGEKCPTGTVITGGTRPVRPQLVN
ncbi:ATP-binding Cassette (ABC) Superfamily [Phytophthora infestans T30-4]|uniref:ATP-binding Cassette (ABC) Superfamily n=1 Tax=Phytophthora infestans (strain T30-4) TaxID=403677 RepID=D0N4B7_PHYIT|nr:ATP-binding Cassette (ABC) Superfamily [Phytophthora infestans T30-4]EEY69725.1 ATP-binding Cassette (ABC) Superfamily [Phytophthora infestans T30-4]|eukprot:XP_002998372.1 ATP-binding Cassette (ABC) Superfamily [Phytophthora infestans T30-4]